MKKSMQYTKYLIIGFVLLLSATGNKVILANRTQGVRRVWEVKATWSGADVPAMNDCLTTSTGRTSDRKVARSDYKNNNTHLRFLIKGYCELIMGNGSLLYPIADQPNNSCSARTRSKDNISGFNPVLTQNKIPPFHENNIPSRVSLPDEQVTLTIKETLRYLERLPGH